MLYLLQFSNVVANCYSRENNIFIFEYANQIIRQTCFQKAEEIYLPRYSKLEQRNFV